jgi:hypothetical protein
MKSAEIMCFLKIFNSQNSIKSFMKITKFLQMVQVGLQKIVEGCFKKFKQARFSILGP